MITTDQGELCSDSPTPADAKFTELRSELTALALGMTGSREDAEDAVQEVWFRWRRHHNSVKDPHPWLRTVTRNVAIDRLRDRTSAREIALDVALAQQPAAQPTTPPTEAVQELRPAFHRILDSLSPLERAVLVLHEGLEWPYPDIARILGRSSAAVRQLGSRAQRHLISASPRFHVNSEAVDAVALAYVQASAGGDVFDLMEALAPGVASRLPKFVAGDRQVVHDVAGIALFNAGSLVLCRRRRNQAWYPSVWDVPGAHRRLGEPAAVCAVRAARYKVGVGVTNPHLWVEHSEDDFRLTLFAGADWVGEPRNLWPAQHEEIGLFSREQAARLPLADPRLLRLFDRPTSPAVSR